jgi:ABC-type transport system involved in multi-copper enzyme maturation permease subunit
MNNGQQRSIFKYNMAFYYKSTIIYFVVFLLYGVIRGEFVEDSFKLITKDPVLYFLAIIVITSVASLLYNLIRNMYIEITADSISFADRFGTKKINIDQIKRIRFSKPRRAVNSKSFRTARIKVNSKIRPVIIRFADFENQDELLSRIEELKSVIEKNSV